MDNDSTALILFAFVALAAVFAFILVLGGPESEGTGNVAKENQLATTHFIYRDAQLACSRGTHCDDGLPGIPTGRFDEARELYECTCQTSNPSFIMWRSVYQ